MLSHSKWSKLDNTQQNSTKFSGMLKEDEKNDPRKKLFNIVNGDRAIFLQFCCRFMFILSNVLALMPVLTQHQTRVVLMSAQPLWCSPNIRPELVQCWPSLYDAHSTSDQSWYNVDPASMMFTHHHLTFRFSCGGIYRRTCVFSVACF